MDNTVTYDDLRPRDQALIDEAGGGNQTVVSARMVQALNGNGNAAIMLSQLLFWARQKADEDGWFYRTADQMQKRCGLGEKAQRNAAETLSDLGLVETDLRGMPAKKHYRVRLREVISLLTDAEQDPAHGKNQDPAHGQKQDSAHGKRPIYRQENKEYNTTAGAREEETPLGAYHEEFPDYRPNARQKEEIQARVDDLDLWREVLKWWRLNGYSAKSIGRMLDKYRQTDSPEDLYGHSGDGRSGSSSGTEQVPIFDDPSRSTVVW